MAKPKAPVAQAMSNSVKVKHVHMAVGLDLVGSKSSFANDRNTELEATSIGIKMFSRKSGRTIIVPYANVKGFELMPEEVAAAPESSLLAAKK